LSLDKDDVWTVIELKAGTARPDAIAQILGYMGCVASERGGRVRGILVASDHSARVVFAANAVPNLSLKKYRYRFDFE
jgi:RecB family endonuclease NucS